MHCKAALIALTFGTAVLGGVAPPPVYGASSSSSSLIVDPISCTPTTTTITSTSTTTKYGKHTSTVTSYETKNVTITPPCPTTRCTKATATVTSVSTINNTITSTITSVSSATVTSTATPGPVVELAAYNERYCAVEPVASNGNAPNFQDVHLTYNAATSSSSCVKITGNPLSFSWDIISFADVPSSCHLYFYFGDSCFDDNGGSQQFSLTNGQDACHNLAKVKSVRLFC